jgi:hypothetical protein
MGYERIYRCDRDLCSAETPPEAHASSDGGAYEAMPTGWIVVQQGTYGQRRTFCSWVCAHIEIMKLADDELDEKAGIKAEEATR